jgi:hypothetical protein
MRESIKNVLQCLLGFFSVSSTPIILYFSIENTFKRIESESLTCLHSMNGIHMEIRRKPFASHDSSRVKALHVVKFAVLCSLRPIIDEIVRNRLFLSSPKIPERSLSFNNSKMERKEKNS